MKQYLILINGRFMLQPVTGVQRSARELIREIVRINRDGFRILIALPRRQDVSPIQDAEMYYDTAILPTSLWQQVRLPMLMRKLSADLLWSPCNIGPLFASRHVISMHDAAPFAGPDWFSGSFGIYYRTLFPLLGRRAVRVITPSTFSKQELIRYGIAQEDRIDIIPGGVTAIDAFDKSNSFKHPYVLTLGSINPRKNLSRLIASWRRIPSHVKDSRRLIIAGQEARCYPWEDIRDISIPDDIIFTGYIPEGELPSLYAGADAFVYPSLYEGFGLPPLEAMAYGCPVITSRSSSMPEVCGDAAYYIDPLSIESIADGIIEILTDREARDSMIQKGRARATLFPWKRSAEGYIKIFEGLLLS